MESSERRSGPITTQEVLENAGVDISKITYGILQTNLIAASSCVNPRPVKYQAHNFTLYKGILEKKQLFLRGRINGKVGTIMGNFRGNDGLFEILMSDGTWLNDLRTDAGSVSSFTAKPKHALTKFDVPEQDLMAMPAPIELIIWCVETAQVINIDRLIEHMHRISGKSAIRKERRAADDWRKRCRQEALQALFDPQHADISLRYRGEEIGRAHRIALIHFSPVWKKMLESNMREAQAKTIPLAEEYRRAGWINVITYLNKGKLELTGENIAETLRLAHTHELQGVGSLCKAFIRETLSIETALEYLPILRTYDDCQDLYVLAEGVIKDHREELKDQENFEARLRALGKDKWETLIRVAMLAAGFPPKSVFDTGGAPSADQPSIVGGAGQFGLVDKDGVGNGKEEAEQAEDAAATGTVPVVGAAAGQVN